MRTESLGFLRENTLSFGMPKIGTKYIHGLVITLQRGLGEKGFFLIQYFEGNSFTGITKCTS